MQTTGRDSSIVHGYDREISDLKLLNIAHLRHVAALLGSQFGRLSAEQVSDGLHYECHPFGKRIRPADISITLIEYGMQYLEYPLTLSGWRQMADSIFTRAFKTRYRPLEVHTGNLSVHGGHQASTRDEWYGLEPGKLREVDFEVAQQQIREFHRVRSFLLVCIRLNAEALADI